MEKVLYPLEGSYNQNDKLDVSIIIPLYKSSGVVEEQIKTWVKEKNLSTEIIYVDDRCPHYSKRTVYKSWNENPFKERVKLICSLSNRGYGGANNLGAYFAQGKHLVFLNADTLVTDNWIQPMIDILQDETVGLVGNLQIKHGGEWHNTIDSAGSEWSWEQMNFMHIGRHICHGKLLEKPMTVEECPIDLLTTGEREMVTGCCFAIRKNLFDEIGGFNLNYRIGYWEDSEMCLTLKSKGYKIMFEPKSVIYHKLHHSQSGEHKFHEKNRHYFFDKWIDSEEIDKYVKAPRISKPTKVSNILVSRRAAHGDVLMATSVLPEIKKKYPDAKIYFHTDCPSVLKNNPYINSCIDNSKIKLAQFQRTFNLNYTYERRPFSNILEAYADECNLPIGKPYLYCEPIEELPKDYIVLHAGKTAWVGRDWENGKHFLEISYYLTMQNQTVVWVGHKSDGPESIMGIDFRGKTNIHQLATVIKNAKYFVGIDSFPFHVAQTFEIPGICYFGSIDPKTRIINQNMKALTAENLACLGCHHRKLAPATVTNTCETGLLECEKLVQFKHIMNLLKEDLCFQNA